MKALTYPQARGDVEAALQALADTSMQQSVWVEHGPVSSGQCVSFNDAIHWIFDDFGLDEGTNEAVGVILFTALEAKRLDQLMSALDNLLVKYGAGLPFVTYFKTPEWPEIAALAGKALAEFAANDSIYGFK